MVAPPTWCLSLEDNAIPGVGEGRGRPGGLLTAQEQGCGRKAEARAASGAVGMWR